jgi:uncharacterized protein YndB with AHSA1/START domain
MGKDDVTGTADREISATRVYDAPRELVWKMWTDPEHVGQWWGPTGFSNTIYAMDVRPGGVWRFCMHGPDGVDYQNKITYVEVVPPERLVYRHGGDKDCEPVNFEVTVTFADEGGKTRLDMRMVFPSKAARDFTADKYGAVEGLHQTLGRLEEKLMTMRGGTEAFVISREFDAPRELVWKAWTERERIMQWFGPKGFTMPVAKLDFRPGGTLHYCLRAPDGTELWGRFVYREIVVPERIVHVNSFSDENGGLGRHPFSEEWPLEMLTTTTFVEREGRTTVTVRWVPINETEVERRTFDGGRQSMKMGWTGTFEQLEAYLAKARD